MTTDACSEIGAKGRPGHDSECSSHNNKVIASIGIATLKKKRMERRLV
jgi:hypothetical protein